MLLRGMSRLAESGNFSESCTCSQEFRPKYIYPNIPVYPVNELDARDQYLMNLLYQETVAYTGRGNNGRPFSRRAVETQNSGIVAENSDGEVHNDWATGSRRQGRAQSAASAALSGDALVVPPDCLFLKYKAFNLWHCSAWTRLQHFPNSACTW